MSIFAVKIILVLVLSPLFSSCFGHRRQQSDLLRSSSQATTWYTCLTTRR